MVENKHLKNIGLHNKTSDANLEKGQKTMMTKLRHGEKKIRISATMSNE